MVGEDGGFTDAPAAKADVAESQVVVQEVITIANDVVGSSPRLGGGAVFGFPAKIPLCKMGHGGVLTFVVEDG